MTEQERLKADIEATRAELAETADALAAKLDVKAQAGQRVQAAGAKLSDRYVTLRNSTPRPVQKAMSKAGQAAHPVVAKAAEDKRRTLLVVAGSVAAMVVFRRVRRRSGPKS